jgi:hypothetical protein
MVTGLSQGVYYLEQHVVTTQVNNTLRSKGSHELIDLLFVTRGESNIIDKATNSRVAY